MGEGIYTDLRFYYGLDLVDVLDGKVAPSFALALVQRLPDDSLTSALASGGREHLGWGLNRHMLADLYDALNLNTRATGQWKKGKAPDFPAWPRPNSKADKAKSTRTSVKELFAKFTRKG